MKLLLDTHIWIWSVLEPGRISKRVRQALLKPDVETSLSSVSVWETLLLIAKGRITVTMDADAWIEKALLASAFREVPLTHAITRETHRVSLPHRDPADRWLVATARVLNLTLVTADTRLLEARQCPVLANR